MVPLLFGIVAIIILLTGVPLSEGYSSISTSPNNTISSTRSSMNMYSIGWIPIVIVTIMLVVGSGLFTYLRIDSNPNRYRTLAKFAAWISVVEFWFGGVIWSGEDSFMNGGYGSPTFHKSGSSVTFWYWLVVVLLVCYAIGITRNYILSQNANDDTK